MKRSGRVIDSTCNNADAHKKRGYVMGDEGDEGVEVRCRVAMRLGATSSPAVVTAGEWEMGESGVPAGCAGQLLLKRRLQRRRNTPPAAKVNNNNGRVQ